MPYNGEKFFIDITDGNMSSLNRIHKISGAPKNQDRRRWIRLENTKKLIKSINVDETHILRTKRGIGWGIFAHGKLALYYVQYLSPELHLAINQVFKERLEEAADTELEINRSHDTAVFGG